MPGSLSRRDSIRRMIRFIKLFYKLEPKDAHVTILKMCETLECTRTNARHWVDAFGDELPIYETGRNKYHDKKGPPGVTFGVVKEA